VFDHEDVDDATTLALFSTGIVFVVAVLFVIFIAYRAHKNQEMCEKKMCSVGLSSKLMNNECLCVERAK